jgi:hypothetical protein
VQRNTKSVKPRQLVNLTGCPSAWGQSENTAIVPRLPDLLRLLAEFPFARSQGNWLQTSILQGVDGDHQDLAWRTGIGGSWMGAQAGGRTCNLRQK